MENAARQRAALLAAGPNAPLGNTNARVVLPRDRQLIGCIRLELRPVVACCKGFTSSARPMRADPTFGYTVKAKVWGRPVGQ